MIKSISTQKLIEKLLLRSLAISEFPIRYDDALEKHISRYNITSNSGELAQLESD